MGIVYKARHVRLARIVALKMILAGMHANPKSVAQFQLEARAVARLRHPHIVQIHEIGEADGLPYIAFEFIAGGNLSGALARGDWPTNNRRVLERTAQLVAQLAQAVHHAHECGIVHRDLKPGNILLEKLANGLPGGSSLGSDQERYAPQSAGYRLPSLDYSPKIADFGLAKIIEDGAGTTQTTWGAAGGTPRYMAPEQAGPHGSGFPVGPSADIYALGAILYELLVGKPLFDADTPLDLLVQVLHQEPVAPRKLAPAIPRDLETICLKCLHKEPAERYVSALELALDLRRFLADEPIAARAPSIWARCSKFARRNKTLAGSLAAVMTALIMGTVVSTFFAFREGYARRLADANTLRAAENARAAERETYRARMAAALLALEGHDLAGLALNLETAPAPLRGWEWEHLHSRLLDETPRVLPLPGGAQSLTALFSAGPRTFVLSSSPASLVDPADTSFSRKLLAAHVPWQIHKSMGAPALIFRAGAPLSVLEAVSPGSFPGRSGDQDWNALSFHHDGKQLNATWKPSKPAHLPNIPSTANSTTRSFACDAEPLRLAISQDGTRLAAACTDGTVRLWDFVSARTLATCRGHTGPARGVAFHPTSDRFLSWGNDGTFRQWNGPDGHLIEVRQAHNRSINDAAYNSDGQLILTGSSDQSVRLWHAGGGDAMAVLRGHTEIVHSVAFQSDGTALVSAAYDGTVRYWPAPARENPCVLRGHTSYVYPVAFSPDGRWFASGGWDNVIRIWDAASGQPITVLTGPRGFIASLAISPDSQRLVARSYDDRLRSWDMSTGRLQFELEDGGLDRLPKNDSSLNFLPQNVAISPDGHVVACGFDKRVRFWDLQTGKEQQSLVLDVKGPIRHVVYNPDGRRLAVAATKPALCLIDLETGGVLTGTSMDVQKDLLYALCFSPDGQSLATAGEDRVIRIWETVTGKLRQELVGHTNQVLALAFHPGGTRLASSGREHDVRLWDLTGGSDVASLRGHGDYVFSLAFSPDGNTLVSGSGDTTVRLWELNRLAHRRAAAQSLQQARPQADALVSRLFAKEKDAHAVLRRIRKDKSLPDTLQQACWHAVLRHGTK
jgi:WD40 repeat protein